MLKTISELLWGPGTLFLLLGTGLFLTFRTGFLPWKNIPFALRSFLARDARQSGIHSVSPFSSLMTTLAATLGTGNIVGVATALVAGGPGALLWMEISALIGMPLILAESTLSVKYRKKHSHGNWTGGPMYVMEKRLGRFGRIWGLVFSLFTVAASLGMGSMTQANAAAAALQSVNGPAPRQTGAVIALLALFIILGGIQRISRISAAVVPLMALLYLAGGIAVIITHLEQLPSVLCHMVRDAFSFRAAAGGTAGAAIRWGIARGIFSNEAGMGSSSIAAAAAETDSPVRQGYVSMTAPFWDTIVMCTVTGLAICCSGVLGATDAFGQALNGAELTLRAMESVLGSRGSLFIAVSIVCFAFFTILGWEYIGETAFSYLSGERFLLVYRFIFALAAFIGSCISLDTVFFFSDICNALMCIPNLLSLLFLSGEVSRDIRNFEYRKAGKNL